MINSHGQREVMREKGKKVARFFFHHDIFQSGKYANSGITIACVGVNAFKVRVYSRSEQVNEFVVRIAYIDRKKAKKKNLTINRNMFAFVTKRERKKKKVYICYICVLRAQRQNGVKKH